MSHSEIVRVGLIEKIVCTWPCTELNPFKRTVLLKHDYKRSEFCCGNP